ncbi:unnamed protein product [Mytilus coruscus]|uniref:Uncharacterized protein n=1 Tax=Mytilus coruscus TaxID=42192 RepID=A0A6J8DTL5_MYTCO|nr:unnamed protein product [Mytilus coruscus]
MPSKGVKRTNTSDISIQNESGNQETKKPSKKKSKQKNKNDSQSDNKGEITVDNISVNKPFRTPIEQSRYGGVNANVNMSQPKLSQDASLKLNKLDQIDSFVSSLNPKVVRARCGIVRRSLGPSREEYPVDEQHSRYTKQEFFRFKNRSRSGEKSAKILKGYNYGISEQLPVEIQKRRKEKLPTLKRLRDENVQAYFVRDKIYVGGKEYVP